MPLLRTFRLIIIWAATYYIKEGSSPCTTLNKLFFWKSFC